MIYLSIGSNIGNRIQNLQKATELLKQHIKNLKSSIVIETKAILPPNAPKEWDQPYLNMIVSGQTNTQPNTLLNQLKHIEHTIGRPPKYQKWAPRIIDIDILMWDNITINQPNLKIPHPELHNRDFLIHLLATMGEKTNNTIAKFTNPMVISPKLIGIVNITNDSFSDGGLYTSPQKASQKINNLIKQGATIIDIGAQSTRPGATIQNPDTEYNKLQTTLNHIKPQINNNQVSISIDTFQPTVIQKLLKNNPKIDWINDVTGNLDKKTLKNILHHNTGIIIMHTLTTPANKNINIPDNQNPISVITTWAQKTIKKLTTLGFTKDKIIIDPGIGFNKTPWQSIHILKNIHKLKQLQSQILIGHSRKSFMKTFTNKPPAERDIETIAISAAIQNKVDYLRVHNIQEHMRLLTTQLIINNN